MEKKIMSNTFPAEYNPDTQIGDYVTVPAYDGDYIARVAAGERHSDHTLVYECDADEWITRVAEDAFFAWLDMLDTEQAFLEMTR
jgi:hypothetical protein